MLELETRRKIYRFIEKNPGLHLREISRCTNIAKSTLTYHINHLKKIELLTETNNGQYKLYYISEKVGREEKELIKILRNKVFRRIYLYMNYYMVFSQEEIQKEFNISKTAVCNHITKLLELGLIKEAQVENGKVKPFPDSNKYSNSKIEVNVKGRKKFYTRKSRELTLKLERALYTYKNSLADQELIKSYLNFLKEIEPSATNKKFVGPNNSLKSFCNAFYEIFRPPFCA